VAWLFLTISAKLLAADPALEYFTEAAAILSGSLVAKAVNKALTLLVCFVVKFGNALDGVITIACEAMNASAIKALVNLDIFTP
jgi:hypothetical protein